jgi:hypothetical protein
MDDNIFRVGWKETHEWQQEATWSYKSISVVEACGTAHMHSLQL